MRHVDLFDVAVSVADTPSMVDAMLAPLPESRPRTIFYVNAHILNMAYDDREFRAVLQRADIVLPDGFGACLAAKWAGFSDVPRVAITDCIWDVAQGCADRELKVFILAGEHDVSSRAADALRRRYPGLEVVGVHHGFLTRDSEETVLAEIRRLRPDVVCVGMGSPIQERLIVRWSAEVPPTIWFAVGAAMDHVSGEVRRARPEWMSRWGLEWAGRLAAEPGRLWRRYLLGNPRFMWRAARVALDVRRRSAAPE